MVERVNMWVAAGPWEDEMGQPHPLPPPHRTQDSLGGDHGPGKGVETPDIGVLLLIIFAHAY